MTLEELRAKVREWDQQNTGTDNDAARYSTILDQLDYHSSKEWRVYLPAEHPDFRPSYMERLASWIGNLTRDDEQKLMLEYALYISFFSHDDFVSLYRTAINREVIQWLTTQIGVRLENRTGKEISDEICKELYCHTWFCPVTDSMDINEFYKVNHLQGAGHRPGFATLQMLAERAGTPNPELAKNVEHYMANPSLDAANQYPPLKRIVLLEDIVGSGSQCLIAIRWAMQNFSKPILFIPLIICPKGIEALRAEELRWTGRLAVRPVIELRRGDLLGPERQGQTGWMISASLEDLARRSAGQLRLPVDLAFGFEQTGCSLVTFSNTPDNSLPMIYHKSDAWEPIFPRVHRGLA